MDLKKLIKEIDYQKEYSYEKRADFFNKYHISVTQNYFNPIYELGKFIIGDRTEYHNSGWVNSCYSHSGAVATNFNSQSKGPKGRSTVRIFKENIILYSYIRSIEKLAPILTFQGLTKTIVIRDYCQKSIEIKRDLYTKIDEWLIDFGYEKW